MFNCLGRHNLISAKVARAPSTPWSACEPFQSDQSLQILHEKYLLLTYAIHYVHRKGSGLRVFGL